jgi:hypothetical protein
MIKRKLKQYRGYECLNCETPLDISEKYCHHCGQLNSTKQLTITDFFEEFLSNFYAYDSRLRNSIISIFTKPGHLAKEFNEGKKQKYANPFRLFLSVSLLLFITDSLNEKYNSDPTTPKDTELINKEKINEELKQVNDSLIDVDKLAVKEQINSFLSLDKDSIYTKTELDKSQLGMFYKINSFRNFNIKYPNKTDSESLKELGFKDDNYNRFFYSKSKLFKSNNIESELRSYFYEKLPFLIFLSLPIITIIFWLLYFRLKINYTEHLVFTYTFFTFLFICTTLFNIIDIFFPIIAIFLITTSFFLLFPIYFYKSLKNFYRQNRWKTVLKFLLLIPMFGVFLTLSTLTMLFFGILLF